MYFPDEVNSICLMENLEKITFIPIIDLGKKIKQQRISKQICAFYDYMCLHLRYHVYKEMAIQRYIESTNIIL